MNKITLAAACLLSLAAGTVQARPAIPYDPALEARVKEIVGKMSREEKIGQICQINVDVICADGAPDHSPALDGAKMKVAFGDYKVGSVLNTPQGHAQTPLVWNDIIAGIQDASMEYIGVPDIYGVDQIHGTTYVAGGTLFPQEINLGAAFSRRLARETARICAYESRAASIPWIFGPVMDIGRNPVWSRLWESFGEDPFVNGALATEMVRGMQGADPNRVGPANAAACLKHYMGYGNPVSGKDRTPTSITRRELREKYFLPFRMSIEAGALSVMVNSGVNDGVPFHADREMLTGWLKEQLDWDGVIVTDWADIHNLWKRDKVAADYKEAIMMAINAGIDMSMTPYDMEFCTLLGELVDEGKVSMDRIDDAAGRIVRLKLRLGLMETPVTRLSGYPDFGSAAHAATALEAALESEVLLKNENGTLPIAKGKRILLTGPNADSMRALNGGWSYTWQGTEDPRYYEGYNTIYGAFCKEFGKENVILETGMDYVADYGKWQDLQNVRIERAVAAAADADVIVACIGENSYCETPGNIDRLTLDATQTELVKALSATGKPIVLVLNEGRPRIIREIEPLASAVVDILLPGNYGGDALALLAAGRRNFSAKLPFTYPKWENSLVTYDHKPCESVETMSGAYNYSADIDVQWPFGYGISYTTYAYGTPRVDKTVFSASDVLTVSVDVTNTGDMEGSEPVILYSSDVVATVTPDVLRVRDFDKVTLRPGETKTVTFTLPATDLAFVGTDGYRHLEKGEFRFIAGDKAVSAECSADWSDAPASRLAESSTPLYLDDSKPLEARVEDALSRMTLSEKVGIIHAQSKFSSPGVQRLGIPGIWCTDGPHGIRPDVLWDEWEQAGATNDSCVAFPALTCLAATWNPEMSLLYGRSIGEEARYRNKNVLLGPGVNIYRTPLNGRNFEYMGEDPFLTSVMVAPYVRGVQQNGVAACVKHYALNNQEADRDHVNVLVDDRTLHEIYLPGFKAAVKEGGAWAIMPGYNKYDGEHACENPALLLDILKGDWGFDGVAISDWGAVHNTEKVASNGLDMEFGSWTNGLNWGASNAYDDYFLAKPYEKLLIEGKLPMKDLDDKARRVLRLIMRTEMDRNRPYGSINSDAHYEAARRIAGEGIVLLKNDRDVLPVAPSARRLLVVGENAIKMMTVGGGSSSLKVQRETLPLDGIRAAAAARGIEVAYERGYVGDVTGEYNGVTTGQDLSETRTAEQLIADAVKAARDADAVIFIGGLNKADHQDAEGCDRVQYGLPYGQDEVIAALAAANPNLTVVNLTGNAVAMPWLSKVPAVVQGWYLGSETGNALADVLFGDVNPSGRLPMTFAADLTDYAPHATGDAQMYPGVDGDVHYKEGLDVGYRHTDRLKPSRVNFPFGHGLSYTTFRLGKPVASAAVFDGVTPLTVTVPVTNTGSRAGAEVVQLYVRDVKSGVKRPLKELKAFGKVSLEPGETRDVTLTLGRDAFAYYDAADRLWKIEPGRFELLVGTSAADIASRLPVDVREWSSWKD